MYSGLAEAYGVYTVLRFFHHYMTVYPLVLSSQQSIHVYCDNSGVIDRIQSTTVSSHPRDGIRDDYPIYAEIQALLRVMHTIWAIFHHVKGHQKATADQQLTLPEKLNIDCDKQASCMSPASTNSPICANPFLPAGYLHLCINHQCIIQCLQHTLHNATTNGSYYDYLLENLEWSESPEHTIHWPMICLALKHFKAVKHWTVTKFIHKWLPLQDHHHVQSTSKLHLCLSCHQTPETTDHF